MENLFSSSIIQVLKDNFVGKTVKVNGLVGQIRYVTLDDMEGYLTEEKLFFAISGNNSCVHTCYDLAALDKHNAIIESNDNHSLPAEDRKDSIVRYIAADYLGTDVKPGQQVLLINCQLDASYMSGICCLVQAGDLKLSLCASLLVNYTFELI